MININNDMIRIFKTLLNANGHIALDVELGVTVVLFRNETTSFMVTKKGDWYIVENDLEKLDEERACFLFTTQSSVINFLKNNYLQNKEIVIDAGFPVKTREPLFFGFPTK